ncbi:unnamed protein product [Rhodiola kirilowii]
MDFITQLPSLKGFNNILVVVHRLTKYAHFVPLRKDVTAESVARAFINENFKLHGVPTHIVSDRDPIFVSKFFRELFTHQGTILAPSTTYHPQIDGQTEVVNHTLEDYLICYVVENQSDWEEFLPWAELSYNTSWHSTINMTPFEVVYGRQPPTIVDYIAGTSKLATVDNLLQNRTELLVRLRTNLYKAQQRMKHFADGKCSDCEFDVGHLVFVRLQP